MTALDTPPKDPLAEHAPAEGAPADNAKPYSVSELAFALKRTLEDAYGFVRLRGELSKVTFHSNGHVYLTLKDDRAAIDGVVWKGSVRGLQVRPEQGLEVIVTGKVTTYPAGSRYQIVIESMEPAGIGALLAQLEKLKARLQAEGLFDAARKRPIPTMPLTVGVITSPTVSGMVGIGRLRAASNSPSACSLAFSFSSWASRAPIPAGSMLSMTI